MIVNKITIEISNNDWYQAGKYLIVKQIQQFKAHQITIVEDEDTMKAIKQIIEDENVYESFIALETNHQVENSILSK